MHKITELQINEQICCILNLNDKLALGSYSIDDGTRTGKIDVYSFTSSNKIQEIQTSGTFDMKVADGWIFVANTKSIEKYDDDFNLIKKINTKTINTYLYIYKNVLYICTEEGNIDIYDLRLNKLSCISVSQDILWVLIMFNKMLISGGEDGILYFISEDVVTKQINIGSGVTALFIEDDTLLVGSYDENIHKVNLITLEVSSKIFIGGGIWRINKYKNLYILTCMYEGLKILNSKFELIKQYNKGSLTYSLCVYNNKIFFSSFYEKRMFCVEM